MTSVRKLLLTGLISMLTASCSTTSRYSLDTDFDSAPVKSKTRMSVALQCMNSQLEQTMVNPSAYVFMVRDVIDGTITPNHSDGPMSDSGRIQMISTLSAHTSPSYGLVIDKFPLIFKQVLNETVGLDRFGFPSQENLNGFYPKLTAIANANRASRGMASVAAIKPLIIDGAFTRNDSSHMRSKGYGSNGGYRGDVDDEKTAAIDSGKSGSERSVTLVINIIDPETNVVIGSEGFDLKYYSNSKTARFRIAVNNYYYGFSNTDVRVETLHAAQQTLLDGAAVWILDNAYGKKVNFTRCFNSPDTIALGRDSRAEAAKKIEVSQKFDAPEATEVEDQAKQQMLPNAAGPSSNAEDLLFQEALKGWAVSNAVGCTYMPNGKCS
jgi:hypothetical protein